MQPIRYNVRRSSFRSRLEAALRGWDRSKPIRIDLMKTGGYARDLQITIGRTHAEHFRSTWPGAEKRFSARLRAAATVLRDLRLAGRYHAVHRDGTVTLEPVGAGRAK